MTGENGEREAVHTFGCGCQADDATGIPVVTCRRHDQRTREVKASAALMQMGNCLDEAAKTDPFGTQTTMQNGLRLAAKYAVKAARAMIGTDEGE